MHCIKIISKKKRTSDIAQWVKSLAAKTDKLSFVSGAYMVEEES